MRPGRMRLSVRGLLLAGAVVAVLLGGVAIPAWRHVEYGRKASLHAEAAGQYRRLGRLARAISRKAYLAKGPTEARTKADEEQRAAISREADRNLGLAERHEALAARYAAAARPWAAPAPDPEALPLPPRWWTDLGRSTR